MVHCTTSEASSKRAQQAWAHHRAIKNMKRAQRHLRRFRKCAVRGRSTFFNALKWWLITPFRTTSPQPDTTSAAEHLPHFAGDPPWRPEEAKDRLSQVLKPGRPVRLDPPSWQSITKALRQPKNKAAGMDHVAPDLNCWLPRELQWDLYVAVRHVCESGDVPHHWLQARIAMIYKSGPPEAARSYRPISIATGMYSILARLILDTLRGPIDAALSDPQAGCRRGYTTSQQALRISMLLHQYGDGALVCLLDIAKAYPSMPHERLTYGLRRLIGTPARIYNMVASIYAHNTEVYGDVRFPLRRGIKEGCPLSPALFVLVYEAFHQTLTREFPNSTIMAYVDDVAIISPNQREMQHDLERVSELSVILGLKTNPSKTHVYRWGPPSCRHGVARREPPTRDAITWGDARLPLQPPIFHYLGHLLAHPTWEQKARDDFVGKAAADLVRNQYLPLNAFERVQLLTPLLIPWWVYRTLFLPNDSMFKAMDSMYLRFVLMAEGMELNKIDVHKSHNVLHVSSPHRLGGMGLHHLFRAHRACFITTVQNTLHSHPGSIGCDISTEYLSRAVSIRNYLAVLTQLGARTALHIALPPRPAGGPNSIDSESSDDGVLLSAHKEQVGCPPHAPLPRCHEDPSTGTVPAGYHPVTIAGIPCYSNQQPPTGTSLYSDGCLQIVEIAGSEYQGAGRSSHQRASSHPRPDGGPAIVLQS